MKKPINVDKIGGKKLFIQSATHSFVFLITEGIDDKNDETTVFINPIEIYSTKVTPSSHLFEGPFFRSDLDKVFTSDKNYEFSLPPQVGMDVRGVIDWEQTHTLVLHIDWSDQIITATIAAVGDGVKGQAQSEQFKFTITDASSLSMFGERALYPYIGYFKNKFTQIVDTSKAATVRIAELEKPVTI